MMTKKDWKTKSKVPLNFTHMKKVVQQPQRQIDLMDKYRNIIKELRSRLNKLRGKI